MLILVWWSKTPDNKGFYGAIVHEFMRLARWNDNDVSFVKFYLLVSFRKATDHSTLGDVEDLVSVLVTRIDSAFFAWL